MYGGGGANLNNAGGFLVDGGGCTASIESPSATLRHMLNATAMHPAGPAMTVCVTAHREDASTDMAAGQHTCTIAA